MKTEAISESTRSGWKPTFDWANSVKAVTKASSSSVSAVFMDTLMMWIGFSLLFWRGWEQNQQLRGNGRQKPFHSQQRSPWSCPPHTDWRTLNTEPSPRAVPRSWRELHQNSCKRQKGKHQQAATLFIYLYQNKNQRKFIYHQVQSDLLKSSTHWKATMAPIRWQGGDNDPSRKSSLLCRLILNCPDPLTGTGTLETRQTHRLWQQRQKDRMTTEKTLNRTEHWSPDQVWPP